MTDITDKTQEMLTAQTQWISASRITNKPASRQTCIYCGTAIPLMRQKAIQGTMTCIRCATEIEQGKQL